MDIPFKKEFMKHINLPDDMIFLIAEYANETVPFKKELLNYKFIKYTLQFPCIYYSNCEYELIGKKVYIESIYSREIITVGTSIKIISTETMFDLYNDINHGYDHDFLLYRKFDKLNTEAEFDRLCILQYNKKWDELCTCTRRKFMMWYIMHYE